MEKFNIFFPKKDNTDKAEIEMNVLSGVFSCKKEYAFSTVKEYFDYKKNFFDVKQVDVKKINSLFAEGFVLFPVGACPYREVLDYKEIGFKPIFIRSKEFKELKKILKDFD